MVSHLHRAYVSCLYPLVNSKARIGDCGQFLTADSSPRERAKQSRAPKPRAGRSWERQEGMSSLGPCPATVSTDRPGLCPSLRGLASLGVMRLTPSSPAAAHHRGYITPQALPLQLSRSTSTAPASHSLQGIPFLFRLCVLCSSVLGV